MLKPARHLRRRDDLRNRRAAAQFRAPAVRRHTNCSRCSGHRSRWLRHIADRPGAPRHRGAVTRQTPAAPPPRAAAPYADAIAPGAAIETDRRGRADPWL